MRERTSAFICLACGFCHAIFYFRGWYAAAFFLEVSFRVASFLMDDRFGESSIGGSELKPFDNPRVYLIGKPSVNGVEVREWLDSLGATEYSVPEQQTPGEKLISLAGKRCYMSFDVSLNSNLTKVRKDVREFIDNILKVGHGSVLEHAVYNFALEGVSRVFTAEMNRHRAGMAISEGSMRFIRFNDIAYWVPKSIQFDEADPPELAGKKALTRDVFAKAFRQDEENYVLLEEIWKDELSPESSFKGKKAITSMMRRVVGMGCATGGVWSGNLRALRHVFNMRCAPEAEEEILWVATEMLRKMAEAESCFFGDFTPDANGFQRPKYPKI